MTSLQRYIADESQNKLGQALDTSEWPIRCGPCPLLRFMQQVRGATCREVHRFSRC